MSAPNTKDQKQLAVSVGVLEVIEKDGLLGVTHSKVARKAGVSRAWIYEYIGKEKSALMEHAGEVLASHFSRANLNELPKSKQELEARLKDGVDHLLDSAELSPVVIKLYFRFRGTQNPIGVVIQKYESQWLKVSSKTLVDVLGLSKDQAALVAELALTLRMGFAHRFVTSKNPGEFREQSTKIFGFIHTLLAGSFEG